MDQPAMGVPPNMEITKKWIVFHGNLISIDDLGVPQWMNTIQNTIFEQTISHFHFPMSHFPFLQYM